MRNGRAVYTVRLHFDWLTFEPGGRGTPAILTSARRGRVGRQTPGQRPPRRGAHWFRLRGWLLDRRKKRDGGSYRRRFLIGWLGSDIEAKIGLGHSGMFPCLRAGVLTRFDRAVSSA